MSSTTNHNESLSPPIISPSITPPPDQQDTPDQRDSPDSPYSTPSPSSSLSSYLSCSPAIKLYIEFIAESLPVTILMSLLTIWALFSDDIRMAATTKEADLGFMIVISIAFFLFSLELIAGSIYKDNYLSLPSFTSQPNETFTQKLQRIFHFGSFYFWLDLIATISLILEIRWIIGDSLETSNQNSLKSARAGRASRAGARAGRIVRLVRMVKLYKYYSDNANEGGGDMKKINRHGNTSSSRRQTPQSTKDSEHIAVVVRTNSDPQVSSPPSLPPPPPPHSLLQGITEESERIEHQGSHNSLNQENDDRRPSTAMKRSRGSVSDLLAGEQESKVGAAMSDITTKRVIVLVLVMLICIPLLTFASADISPSFGTSVFHNMVKSSLLYPNSTYQTGITLTTDLLDKDFKHLLSMKSNDVYYIHHKDKQDSLRASEIVTYEFSNLIVLPTGEELNLKTIGKFSIQDTTRLTALYGIYLTLFILFLLVVGTYYFSSDVNKLVIIPIEKMVSLVKEISKNPLGVEYTMLGEEDGFLEGMETTLLLQTINKIGGLMRVGFGEAGASVIAKNLSNSNDNKLNLMGSGTLIHSIFGFCDVRNFTDTTECLQEEVMLFVNRIAHILHGIVVQCSGSANKNIGDAFLLTWKIDEGINSKEISYLADQALLAFLKSIIELTRYQDFICNFSIIATNRLYKRFPGYKVRIGSGLHVGWAVEGAIGSSLKIDVTYLSPHVGMSEYLESSTKAYGVPLLLSEAFYKLLTPTAAKYCRQIDRIRRSEYEEPFGLFTYDCDMSYEYPLPEGDMSLQRAQKNKRKLIDSRKSALISGSISVPRNGKVVGSVSGSGQYSHSPISGSMNHISAIPSVTRSESKSQRDPREPGSDSSPHEGGKERKEEDQKPTVIVSKYLETVWESDMDLIRLRHLVNENFRKLWKEGMAAYIKGDWAKAKAVFKETLRSSNGEDGPSKFLVSFMEEHGGMPPRDWEGYHNG